MSSRKKFGFIIFGLVFPLSSCFCQKDLSIITIDGSSTVYVISEAIAEEFYNEHQGKISIGVCGTGGGFKKLCSKRVDIIGASRKIKDSEKNLCQSNNIQWAQLPVAYDGIVIAVNVKNDWIHSISTHTLKKLFEPEAEGKISTWKDLDPAWPNRAIQIFAPGISSGTYDYFTKSIVGQEHASRGDITTSEDDNVLVQGVISNLDGLAFFSLAYYLENKDKLKILPLIDLKVSQNAVMPNAQSIQSGEYSPLSRHIYIYANKNNQQKTTVSFLTFYLKNAAKIAAEVGFIPLTKDEEESVLRSLKET